MNRRQRILLWLACSAIFFEAFDVSIVNLAIPLIAADLHVSLASAQWIQTVYLLSFGGVLMLGGRLCDPAQLALDLRHQCAGDRSDTPARPSSYSHGHMGGRRRT